MIKLVKDSDNYVVLTLNEKVTIDAPVYFLFRFINDETQESKTCLSSDITGNLIERYNKFLLIEGSPEAPSTGKLSIKPGQYSYEVYAQNSNSNLDYALANEVVETGRALVLNSSIVNNETYEPIVEVKVYDPTAG